MPPTPVIKYNYGLSSEKPAGGVLVSFLKFSARIALSELAVYVNIEMPVFLRSLKSSI